MKSYKPSKLSESVTKIIALLRELFLHPVTINACLHYNYGILRHRNWGDDLNIYLLDKLWRKPLSYIYTSILAARRHPDNYIAIGSTLAMLSNQNAIVWGAGVIGENERLDIPPKKILAVRGPKTRQWLLDKGVDCPEIYGDPAMLLAEIYTPKKTARRYKLGIIPHYDDFDHPSLQLLKNDPEVLFIRMEGYKNWLGVIDDIASCDFIASSSLHGLIMAEAYGVPNLWIEISGSLMGGHFKFHDFFLSIGVDRDKPYQIKIDTTKEELLSQKDQYQKGHIDLAPLKAASPFPINISKI